VDYIIECSNLNYGMTYKKIHWLAYDNGRLQCKFSSNRIDNKIAGIDWLQGFTQGLASSKIQVSSGPQHSRKQT